MNRKSGISTATTELRHRAEARLQQHRQETRAAKVGNNQPEVDNRRLPHELQVHQLELEMQNLELQESQHRADALLEKYTDLYDFAPVGYFSLDEQGRIMEANLTGAGLLGVERSRLIRRRFALFVAPNSRSIFLAFLERVVSGTGKEVCEAALLRENAAGFWASLHGISAISISGPRKWCRVAVSDITSLKQGEEAQDRMEGLADANRELKSEILRRLAVEKSLKRSEQHQRKLLAQSRLMQEQLRHLSRQVLRAQEEERKRISRELHDVIAQILTGINVRLAALKKQASLDTRGLDRRIDLAQKMVIHSVEVVHRFARELRPTVLDDLGLIPALHAFMKSFRKETGICVSLSSFARVEEVNGDKRTVLFRVAQEALTNIARHAKASQAAVQIQKRDGAVCMTITDNGKGFLIERKSHRNQDGQLGLLGMKERLEMVGGSFSVSSARGKGTSIVARIPVEAPERPRKRVS